ncbi:uncharacterized protein DSM5745_10417 [Aspergillus mulundensis]|uniref:Rhodopsin domain-containing protein n=1 Tax=Aspergillus mulundensis TaxID=1810919 RepID=A0A3D8QIW1_9EURO|nr:Uncharacterized protein DSM5745_10417 [Aspergillus mulundensis]RDW61745.1 Uncharacterized protein DSM5745_10417 [Aspergillus mulundensis]
MGYCGIAIVVGKYGGGFHYTDVDTLTEYRKFCYIATVLYCPMALFTKIALLSILVRIFSPYKSRVRFIYGFLAAITIYYVIAEIVKIRMCDPVPGYWTMDPNAKCLDQRAALIADSVISMVSDILILILPLPLTWSLQMSRNKKLRVIGMLSAGGLATAFSIYRIVLVLRDGSSPDITIFFICVILSGNAEGGMGLICACLPSLNILIAKVRNHSYRSKSGYYEQQSTDMKLSKVKGATPSNTTGSRRDPEDHELVSDESGLITHAGAAGAVVDNPAGRKSRGGIHKTVDVQQTVEVLADRAASTSPPRGY